MRIEAEQLRCDIYFLCYLFAGILIDKGFFCITLWNHTEISAPSVFVVIYLYFFLRIVVWSIPVLWYFLGILSHTCPATLSRTIQSGEGTDVGRQRLNHSSLSLSRFSELNKALDTNEYNRWRVFIFPPQELQTRSDLSSAHNILFARITSNEPVCFDGWNKFSVPIWSPWEPNLTRRRSGCQLDLLSVNFDFRNVIFQPMVFPFVLAKYKWNFMRDRCKLSFPLPLAASPLTRAFSLDSLHSPK